MRCLPRRLDAQRSLGRLEPSHRPLCGTSVDRVRFVHRTNLHRGRPLRGSGGQGSRAPFISSRLVDVADDLAVEPRGEPLAPRRRARGARGRRGRRGARPRPARRRPAPSSRRSGRPTRRWCRRCRRCRRGSGRRRGRGRSRAASSPWSSGRGSAAARRPASTGSSTSRSSGSSQPVSPESSDDRDRAEVGQGTAYGGLGGAEPPDQVGLGAGTEPGQPAADQLGVAVGLGAGPRLLPQPVGHRRPPRPGDPPVAAVDAAHDLAAGAEPAEDPRGDRDRAAPLGAGRDGDLDVERGQPLAQLLRPQRARRRRAGRGPRRRRAASQASPSSARPAVDRVATDPLALGLGDAGRGAPPGGRQQVAREDEEGPAHRELLDQRCGRRRAPGRRRPPSTPSVRAATERWTEAGSVAWSTTIARVAASGVGDAVGRRRVAWRRTSRARRSSSVTWRALLVHGGIVPDPADTTYDGAAGAYDALDAARVVTTGRHHDAGPWPVPDLRVVGPAGRLPACRRLPRRAASGVSGGSCW